MKKVTRDEVELIHTLRKVDEKSYISLVQSLCNGWSHADLTRIRLEALLLLNKCPFVRPDVFHFKTVDYLEDMGLVELVKRPDREGRWYRLSRYGKTVLVLTSILEDNPYQRVFDEWKQREPMVAWSAFDE